MSSDGRIDEIGKIIFVHSRLIDDCSETLRFNNFHLISDTSHGDFYSFDLILLLSIIHWLKKRDLRISRGIKISERIILRIESGVKNF